MTKRMRAIEMAAMMMLMAAAASCEKEQKGCMLDRTALFYVENQSKDTASFELIQEADTIRQEILPYRKYSWRIKAGVETKSYVYRADTLYRKTMEGWKCKRCEMDGHLIR